MSQSHPNCLVPVPCPVRVQISNDFNVAIDALKKIYDRTKDDSEATTLERDCFQVSRHALERLGYFDAKIMPVST